MMQLNPVLHGVARANFKDSYFRNEYCSLPADVNSPLPREALGETRLPYREINSPQPSHISQPLFQNPLLTMLT